MLYEHNGFQDKRLPVGASALLKLEGKVPFSPCIQIITTTYYLVFLYTFSKVLGDYGSSWKEMIRLGSGSMLFFLLAYYHLLLVYLCVFHGLCCDSWKVNGYLIPIFPLYLGRVCRKVHEHPPQELVGQLTMSPGIHEMAQ
jgi:hypothetical protein